MEDMLRNSFYLFWKVFFILGMFGFLHVIILVPVSIIACKSYIFFYKLVKKLKNRKKEK